MKYIVKCPYCGQVYTKDVKENDIDFSCDSCGAQNTTRDAIETIYTETEKDALEKAKEEAKRLEEEKKAMLELQRKRKLQELYEEESEDEEKAQDEFLQSEHGKKQQLILAIGFLKRHVMEIILFFTFFMLPFIIIFLMCIFLDGQQY